MKANFVSRFFVFIFALCVSQYAMAYTSMAKGVGIGGNYNGAWGQPPSDCSFTLVDDDTWLLENYTFSSANNVYDIIIVAEGTYSWQQLRAADSFNVGTPIELSKDFNSFITIPSSSLGPYNITVEITGFEGNEVTTATILFEDANAVAVEDTYGHKGVGLAGSYFGTTAWGNVARGQKMTYDETDGIWTITGVEIDTWGKDADHRGIYIVTDNGEEWRNTTDSNLASSMDFAKGTTGYVIEVNAEDEGVYKVEVMFGGANNALVSFTRTGDLVPTPPDVAGNNHVSLAGGFFNANSWQDQTAKALTYQGHNVWSIENLVIDPSSTNSTDIFVATDNNWAQWKKTTGSNIEDGVEMAFGKSNGNNLQVQDIDAGTYNVTITFIDDTHATVVFNKKVVTDDYGHKGIGLIGSFVGYSQWSDIPKNKRFEYNETTKMWVLKNFVIDTSESGSNRELIFIDSEGNKYYKYDTNPGIDADTYIDIEKADNPGNGDIALQVADTDDGIYTIYVSFTAADEGSVMFDKTADLPEPPSLLTYYDDNAAPKPGVVKSIKKKIDGSNTVVCNVMIGTTGVKYYDKNNNNFATSTLSWLANNHDSDLSDADAFNFFAEPQGSNYNPMTEVNGGVCNDNATDGGLFLAPVSGDFIRVEPRYNGTVTLWVRQGQNEALRVIDQNGVAVAISAITNAKDDGTNNNNGQNSKYSFTAKAGYTYYVALKNAALRFAAIDMALGDNNPGNVYIYEDQANATSGMPAGLADVILGREFTSGWMHPIVLPFSVSESMMKQVFGNGVQVLYLDPYANSVAKGDADEYKSVLNPAVTYDDTDECYTIRFTKHYYQMLYAGVPAFVIPSQNVSTPLFSNVTIETSDIKGYAVDAEANFTVTGSYAPSTPNTTSPIYYISNDEVNGAHKIVLHRAKTEETDADKVNMRAMRVWIQANASARPIKGVGFNSFTDEDEEVGTSGIVDIAATAIDRTADTKVYNMLGIPVADGTTDGLAPGIYIHQGRKVVVK